MQHVTIEFTSGETERWADIVIEDSGWIGCIGKSGQITAYYPDHVIAGVLVE